MKLTKKRAIELHRKLWDWLSKHPDKRKSDWPEWADKGGKIGLVVNDCFLCEYALCANHVECTKCLLLWPTGSCCTPGWVSGGAGLFTRWSRHCDMNRLKVAARLAAQIRDLPESKKERSAS